MNKTKIKMKNQSEKTLKQAIENLIKAGTSFDLEQLELIYHNNLKVFMVGRNGINPIFDKQAIKNLFQSKRENGDAHLNNWVEYNHIEANGDFGHVIVTRKINLTGIEQRLVLSLDLVWEENRWQVIREVTVNQPESE